MRWTLAALLAVAGIALPLTGLGRATTQAEGLTILYTVDERGEISPCG